MASLSPYAALGMEENVTTLRLRTLRRCGALLTLAVVSTVDQAFAVPDNEFARCAATEGDLARLSCFDSLGEAYGLNGPQAQPTAAAATGSWVVKDELNPIDDSRKVTLSLVAESGQSKWGRQVVLIARCSSSRTEAFIAWNDYLGREANVLYRMGSEKAVTERWGLSTDSKATFARDPIRLLTAMLGTSKFLAQVTPYNDSPVTAIFDTTGLDNAIVPLREACEW